MSDNIKPIACDCWLVRRAFLDTAGITAWARQNIKNKFALGALAAMNYVRGLDDAPPQDRVGDINGILKALEIPLWVKNYLESDAP